MATLQAPFFASTGEAKGKFDLPDSVFSGEGSRRTLFETLLALQANQRRGTSATKTRGLVSGGGHKPWKQKGTGNARSGSNRSPLWRKGGIIFGPQPRSYRIDIDSVKRDTALQTALIEKAKAGQLNVMDSLSIKDGKTQNGYKVLQNTKLQGSILLVMDKIDAASIRALKNINRLCVATASDINALGVMKAGQVLMTKAALEAVASRLPKG